MIGKIGPLVQADISRRQVVAGLHLAGGALGGVCAGLVLGFLGLLAEAAAPASHRVGLLVLLPAALVYGAVADSRLLPLPRISWARQTPSHWACALGRTWVSLGWAFDLGVGLTTRLTYQSYMAVVVFAVFSGNLWISVATMGLFGLARAGAVVAAVATFGDDFGRAASAINARTELFTHVVAAAGLFIAGMLLAAGANL
jgi:hypothetical protein